MYQPEEYILWNLSCVCLNVVVRTETDDIPRYIFSSRLSCFDPVSCDKEIISTLWYFTVLGNKIPFEFLSRLIQGVFLSKRGLSAVPVSDLQARHL